MSKQLLKTQHYTVWLLRERGSNWMRIHAADVDMAEDNYLWRGKIYPLKSTNLITYTTGRLGIQKDLLMFNADTCEPLFLWKPDIQKYFLRSSAMVGQSLSEEALRNSESIATIRRQQKIMMILGVGLAISIVAVMFFAMYSFGLFKMPTTAPMTPTGPRAILQAIRGLFA